MELVDCPHCKARVRADRMLRHIAHAHPPPDTQPTPRSKKRRRRSGGGTSNPGLPSAFEGSSMKDWDTD